MFLVTMILVLVLSAVCPPVAALTRAKFLVSKIGPVGGYRLEDSLN